MAFFEKFKKKMKVGKEELPTEKNAQIESNKEIIKNKIVLYLIPHKTYQSELLEITKKAADKLERILYISLNRPAEKVVEILRENNIDTEKFLFIDAVHKEVKEGITYHNLIFIDLPKDFEKFNTELNQIIEKEKIDCLIFDSLSTLLIYQNENIVIKFAHDLITKLISVHECAVLICLSEDVDTGLVKDIHMFADEVIDLGKEAGVKPIDSNKKEKIDKLEKELKAVREAYASKFLSEQSYLNTKERIVNDAEAKGYKKVSDYVRSELLEHGMAFDRKFDEIYRKIVSATDNKKIKAKEKSLLGYIN